jgi:tRNA(Ile)-lysidine synthase
MAIAVSGGRDSVALLRLCADYAKGAGAKLKAFTIDHGLRAGSGDEAMRVRDWCAQAGVAHDILLWKGEKPQSGIQEAARRARYGLLIEAALRAGCEALLTAHTLDDQAETLFMRLARGAGVKGLSSIRERSLVAAGAGAPLLMLRPLLSFSRRAVTSYLQERDQSFLDDPSNDDPHFERVRVRALLAALEEQDLLTGRVLSETAQKLAAAFEHLQAQEDALFVSLGGCFYAWGGVSLDRWDVSAASAGGLARRLLHAVSGAEYAPDEMKSGGAAEQAMSSGAATLSGAAIKRSRGRLWFFREPAALTGRAGVAPAERQPLDAPLLWDGRFILEPPEGFAGLSVGPLGPEAAEFLSGHQTLFQGPSEALSGLPGLYAADRLIGAPALPFMNGLAASKSLAQERYMGGIVRFL